MSATRFKFMRFPKDGNAVCGCYFCGYEKMKEEVEHMKLFMVEHGIEREFYLNINNATGECILVEKE